MKRITYIIAILFACTSCSDTFLDNAPKGKYHEGNYDMGTAQELLVLATLMDGYNVFAQQTWPVTAMQCHTTDNSHPGGPSGDGGVDFSQFPTMSFTPANSMFNTYYSLQYYGNLPYTGGLQPQDGGAGSSRGTAPRRETGHRRGPR